MRSLLSIVASMLACFLLVGCSSKVETPMHLQDYGAKITKKPEGVQIDLRNAPDFDDSMIELVLEHSNGLVDLTLQNVAITDVGIEKLVSLDSVGRLILNDTKISGRSLTHLAGSPLRETLRNLGLKNTAIADKDIKTLAEFPNLIRIDLSGTQVTDAGVAMIPERGWSMINLKDTKVTAAAVAKLREQYPRTDVMY